MRPYDAIFFDAANTLLYPFPSVGILYAEVAARYGIRTTAEAVQSAFRQTWTQTQEQVRQDPVRYGVGEPDGRRFWHALVYATFSQIALPDNFDPFFDELYHLFAQPDAYRTFPESLDVLQQLRQQGYIVGVISNWDSRLTRILDGLGLTSYLHHVSISAVVGWEKPHQEIFRHALEAVAVQPSRALHIGDSLSEDIQGASNAGLQPLWLQRDAAPQSDFPVIRDLHGVLSWVAERG
ncbi:MAG TPA: HAD-IA family hydrolase [Candidatus Entotheonella sp.]|jgi:putative hydrolase of the HAD superfamily